MHRFLKNIVLNTSFKLFFSIILSLTLVVSLSANSYEDQGHEGSEQQDDQNHHNHDESPNEATHVGDIESHSTEDHSNQDHGHGHGDHHVNDFYTDCGAPAQPVHHSGYDPTATAIHHISDANVLTIMDWIRIPLPMIIYNKERGIEFFSSGQFHAGHHDNGHSGYKDYVLYEGNIHRIVCEDFQADDHFEVEGFDHAEVEGPDGKSIEKRYAIIDGKGYLLEQKTIWDGGMLGGGMTSFYDLSPTKNVITMLLVCGLLFFMFRSAAKAYSTREGQAPRGIQSFLEPVFQYIRDEVAVPFLGDKHERFLPLLMAIFFFILGLNLWGQVPFLGSVNVTGSLTVTMVLAILVFIITNVNGNKHYWQHILNMPGVPFFVKIILTPVEILGMFIKPLTLMLRLAGNISAGHIAILSFVGLIFIFGKAGDSLAGSIGGTAIAIPLTLFMMAIELIVAFIQAFVFTLLAASYLGDATADHDDHH